MKKYIFILPLLAIILSSCEDKNDLNSRPIIAFWSKIYFEDQLINDSISGLERHIDYSLGNWGDIYTGGDSIETKILRSFLYEIDCSFDNGAEEMWGGGMTRFDTDELTGTSYIILSSSMELPVKYEGTHYITYKLYCPAIFGDDITHTIKIKYDNLWGDHTPIHLIPVKECYIDGKPGKILDYESNILKFKVFD